MSNGCEVPAGAHSGDQTDTHGRCLGVCRECDTHLESSGRNTVYCPSCDVCPTCHCPNVDGFSHYAGCADAPDDDDAGEDHDDDAPAVCTDCGNEIPDADDVNDSPQGARCEACHNLAPDDDDAESVEDHDDDETTGAPAVLSEIETPNLDSLDADDLDAVCGALAILARYAHTKRRAVRARLSGNIPDAVRLESQTDALYKLIPAPARSW